MSWHVVLLLANPALQSAERQVASLPLAFTAERQDVGQTSRDWHDHEG
jgi:hypothetical protein